jgi:DNA (cytosine-5)-methyltransferase 1
MAVPVIDLFAGPGGLGEGFSSIRNIKGEKVYKISLSIEKDASAHKTLELRSFFRQFPDGEAPEDYYKFLRQEGVSRDALFSRYKNEAQRAQKESWHFELAENNSEKIGERINADLQKKY